LTIVRIAPIPDAAPWRLGAFQSDRGPRSMKRPTISSVGSRGGAVAECR